MSRIVLPQDPASILQSIRSSSLYNNASDSCKSLRQQLVSLLSSSELRNDYLPVCDQALRLLLPDPQQATAHPTSIRADPQGWLEDGIVPALADFTGEMPAGISVEQQTVLVIEDVAWQCLGSHTNIHLVNAMRRPPQSPTSPTPRTCPTAP